MKISPVPETRVKVVKNKMAPPFRQVEFDIMYNEGISAAGEILDLAVESGIIEKSGAWYSYGDDRIGQGRENVKGFLKENPEILADVRNKILEAQRPASNPRDQPEIETSVSEAEPYEEF